MTSAWLSTSAATAMPCYWVVPTLVAAGRITSEQITTSDVAEFERRWDLQDGGEPA